MNLLVLLLGLVLTLGGLLLVGAQVNKHQIKPNSSAAWIWRGGVLLLFITARLPEKDSQTNQVIRILGAMLIAASLIIVNHEWVQAGDLHLGSYQFEPTLDMLLFFFSAFLGNIGLLIGLAQNAPWATVMTPILLMWMLFFSSRLFLSTERRRAEFQIGFSLSAQILVCGALLLIAGTWFIV